MPSRIYHTGDGTRTVFDYSFPTIDRSHIRVTVNGAVVQHSYISATQLRITPAPPQGASILIRRWTPKDPLVVFKSGIQLKEKVLDWATRQSLYAAEEAADTANSAEVVANNARDTARGAAQTADAATGIAQGAAETARLATITAAGAVDTSEAANRTAGAALGASSRAEGTAAQALSIASLAASNPIHGPSTLATFPSRVAAAGASIPAGVQSLLVQGLYYKRDASGAALQTADGQRWAPLGDPSVLHFGALGMGIGSDRAALVAAFRFASATGLKLTVPAGTYLLDNTLSWSMQGDTHIEMHPGARFVAMPGFPVDNRLVQPSVGQNKPRLVWSGGVLDGRSLPARATGAPDLLYMAGDASAHISGVTFITNDTRAGNAGDSHLFLAEGEDYWITDCIFQGAVDSAIYISGDNTGTRGRRARVTGCTFLECRGAVIFKRQFEEVTASGNMLSNCGNGIILGGEVDSVTGLLTASKGVISSNIFRGVLRPIEARIAHGTIITANRIENHGTDAAGVEIAEGAIVIAGSNRCIVSGNHIIRGRPNAHASLFGIRILTRTWEGTTYPSNGNVLSSNVVAGVGYGVHEAAGCDGNIIGADNSLSAETPAHLSGPSSLRLGLPAGGPRDLVGAGSPEGKASAPVGSTYRRTDGAGGSSFYVKESGTGSTGWVAK